MRWAPAGPEEGTEAQRTTAGPVLLAREQARRLPGTSVRVLDATDRLVASATASGAGAAVAARRPPQRACTWGAPASRPCA